MNRLFIVLSFAVVVCGGCAGAYPEKAVDFDSFRLVANLKPGKIEKIKQDVIEFDTMCRAFLRIKEERNVPLKLKIFARESECRSFIRSNPYDYSHFVASFKRDPDSYALAMYARGRKLQRDMGHALSHYYVETCFSEVPVWFEEGLAEYLEVGEIGKPNKENLRPMLHLLQREPGLPLELLFEKDTWQRFHDRHVWQAWALVFYMIHGAPDYELRFKKLLDGLNAGKEFKSLFNDLYYRYPEMFARDWRHFIRSLESDIQFHFTIQYSKGY